MSNIAATTRHGFTEHEHQDNLALIHMNGRVQDPVIGRFLSADPFVQAPEYGQSLNRHAYVWNNPLTLIDPSGFNTETESICDPGNCGGASTSSDIPTIGRMQVNARPTPPPPLAIGDVVIMRNVAVIPAGDGSARNGSGEKKDEPQGEQRCTRQSGSLAEAIRDRFAKHVFELNYTAGGLATFGGLLGRTDTGENNAQIIQSQVFVNSRGQIGIGVSLIRPVLLGRHSCSRMQ